MSPLKKKVLLLACGFVVVLFLLAVFVVPAYLNINRYRSQVEARLKAATGKPVHIGHLALALFPRISVRVDDFQIGNPDGFPAGELLSVKRIDATLSARALWHRVVKITSLNLHNPNLHLLSDGQGHWNFQSPPKAHEAGSSAPAADRPLFTLGVISQLRIENGEWSVADVLPSQRAGPPYVEGQGVSTDLRNVTLSVFGARGASASPRASLSDWLFPTAEAAEQAAPMAAQGSLAARNLQFGALQCSSFKSDVRAYSTKILFDKFVMSVAGGRATGNLTLDFSGPHFGYSADAQLQKVDMAQLLEPFPQARGKMTGTLDGTVKLTGEVAQSSDPLSTMNGSGQLRIRNGTMPTLQLNRNLLLLAHAASLGSAAGNPSSFSSISADFDVSGGIVRSRHVVMVGNGVDVNGAGSLALVGRQGLDYTGVAMLEAGPTGLTNVLAGVLGGSYHNGKLSFPFSLTGTLDNPRFILSAAGSGLANLPTALGRSTSGSAGQTRTQQGSGLLQTLQGLFGKRNPTTTQPKNP